VRTLYYVKLGRLTNDCVTTVGSGTDSSVLQIASTFEVRGLLSTLTSFNSATQFSGTVQNQIQFTYNTFGQLTKEQQSHSGTATTSTPSVQYAYDTGGSSSNEIRLNQLTYPNARTLGFSYGTSGGINDTLNRVDTIQDTTGGSTNLASYTYLGSRQAVRIAYPQPSVWLDLWGGTSGTFIGLDQFNRTIDQRWQNNTTGTPADIDRYQYGYGTGRHIFPGPGYKANVVGTPIVSGGLDEGYAYDSLQRLITMERGTLSGTIIVGTPSRSMGWTLDPTGNWSQYETFTSGTADLNQSRTANKVNEITNLTESTGPTWVVPAYDAAGNMTTMPQPATVTASFTATYDAWNRMVSISNTGGTVATYQYYGQNRRIVKYTAAIPETRHFYWNGFWQDIEERVGSSTTADKQYVWAAPNMVDKGFQYVDALVCRDDPTYGRLYAMQDANFNLTSICNTSGTVQERYYYDPYGTQFIMNGSWTSISSSAYAWVIGHQGLLIDVESNLIYNRNRYIHPLLGSFISRDPVGYLSPFKRWLHSRENRTRASATGTYRSSHRNYPPKLSISNQLEQIADAQEAINEEMLYRSDDLSRIDNYLFMRIVLGMNVYEYELNSPTTQVDPMGLCPPTPPCGGAGTRSPNCNGNHANCSMYLPWDPIQYGVCRAAPNAPGAWGNCVRGCLQRCECSFWACIRFSAPVFAVCHAKCFIGCKGGGNPPY